MKFVVENEGFAKGLSAVKDALKKSTIPALQHIAIEAREGVVQARATNLAMELKATIPASVEVQGGAAVPGAMLVSLASGLTKGGQVEVELVDGRLKVASGRSKFDLQTLPIEEFPSRADVGNEEVISFAMPAQTLSSMLESTVYPSASKNPHFYSQGVYLHVVGSKLRAVATDHFRLALRETTLPKGAKAMPGVVIPTETTLAMIDLLGRYEGDAELSVGSKLIEVACGQAQLSSVLIDCKFPEYERVIPKPNGRSAEFSAEDLSEAVKRATVVFLGAVDVKNKVQSIKFEAADGLLKVFARSGGVGEEAIEAETSEEQISDLLNAPHLQQMLAAWPDGSVLRLHQAKERQAVLFECKDHPDERHVIMPCLF